MEATLGHVIDKLASLPASTVIRPAFGEPMSYRGYFDQVAFEPVAESTAGEMLKHAQRAMKGSFEGYKGGDYTYDRSTVCWIADYGMVVDDPVHVLDVEAWGKAIPVAEPAPAPVAADPASDAATAFAAAVAAVAVAATKLGEAKAEYQKAASAVKSATDRALDAIRVCSKTPERAFVTPHGVALVSLVSKKASGDVVANIRLVGPNGAFDSAEGFHLA